MSNRFGISRQDEEEILARDNTCVYCHKTMCSYAEIKAMKGVWSDQATIEHLNCNGPFYCKHGLKKEDIVMCCRACNSSRGDRTLPDWFKTDYCRSKNVNEHTVADSVKTYLNRMRNRRPGDQSFITA